METVVVALAEQIAANAPLTVAACKAAVRAVADGDEDTGDVDAMVEACFASEDYREGQSAFLAKRDPLFRGV